MNRISPIINTSELNQILNDKNLVILDARVGKDAYQNYLEKHIKAARFIDLENDLANVPENPANGGRHPLPEIFYFAKTLSDLGTSQDSHVVVYDDKNGSNAAARAWWMLKAFGLQQVQVLNGGFQAAEKEGIEMFSGKEPIHPSSIKIPEKWLLPTKNINELEREIANKTSTVIDVRDAYRFNGTSEPIDLIAGHIPGAINIPFSENLDENGYFLKPEMLRKKYADLLKDKTKNLIIHCGSGVTACHTILAMDYAGFEIPNLYVGSWSEWSRNNKPIGK